MKTKNTSSFTIHVRQRIRHLREQNGLTQDKLCEYAGISSDSITRIEGGSRVPRLDTLEKIARVSDTDVSSLVSTGKMS
jgi:transcriptional regulator with XRE-family HTH domain